MFKHGVNIYYLFQGFRVRIPRRQEPGRPAAERNQGDRWRRAQSLDRLISCLSLFVLLLWNKSIFMLWWKWTDSSWTVHEFLDVYLDKDWQSYTHSHKTRATIHRSGYPNERAVSTPLISQLHLTSFRELDEFSSATYRADTNQILSQP